MLLFSTYCTVSWSMGSLDFLFLFVFLGWLILSSWHYIQMVSIAIGVKVVKAERERKR